MFEIIRNSPYIEFLKENDYEMTLRNTPVQASEVYDRIISTIENVYNDVITDGEINADKHPDEYRLFNNPHRVVDGPW